MKNETIDQELIKSDSEDKFSRRPLIIWLSVLVLGLIFKFMHWPGANIIILISTASITGYAFYSFIFYRKKHPLPTALLVLSLIWIAIMIMGIYFNDGYPFNSGGLEFFFAFVMISFITFFLSKKIKVSLKNSKQ